ncbi:hypothetical protein BV25DRAFT_1920199 [Artomyces pyxidatus]|uniref:Uncharacterized protein n=1 Tax=Artomyces pyxidatus TaxID=48021 RepID=A0ACB8SNQ0_9AGAM|nr:hypothetical protein BV25DRAFT_1920199 [Artomyces pyxidatus]
MRGLATSSSTQPYDTVILIGLLVLAVYQAIDITVKVRTLRTLHLLEHPEAITYSYVGDEHPNAIPVPIPQVAMRTEWPDDELYGLFQDDEWMSLYPRSHGLIALGPQSELFAVSMYHQLHCVDGLRYAYVAAKSGTLVFPGNGSGVEHHVNHCLTYLREMVLCAGDTTLEPTGAMPGINAAGKVEHGATGQEVLHRCRDWTAIREYMEENFEGRLRRGEVEENGDEIIPPRGYSL